MSINLSDQDIKSIRSDLSRIIVAPAISGKMNLKKAIHDAAHSLKGLGGNNFIHECELLIKERNKTIETKILSGYGGANKDDMQTVIEANQLKLDQDYQLQKHWGDLEEDEIRNLLPEDKIAFNKEIFHERLKGVEFKDLPPVAEKKIITDLVRDSIGLLREEVILYYNLIKVNRLAVIVEEKRAQKKTEDIAKFQRMADAFISSLIPKFLTLAQLKEINNGTSIDRNDIRESIIEKIKASQFNPIPYITLATLSNGDIMNKMKEILNFLSAKKNESGDKLWNLLLVYILFQNTTEESLPHLNLSKDIQLFIKQRRGKLSQSAQILLLFTENVFLNLCKQLSEIRSKYQKMDETNKRKIYKLYGDEERLAMLFNASVDLANKSLDLHKGELSELTEFMKKYAKKNPVLNKNQLFG